jgi:hypothetical protein
MEADGCLQFVGGDYDGLVNQDHHVVSFLGLLKQPYPGCDPARADAFETRC